MYSICGGYEWKYKGKVLKRRYWGGYIRLPAVDAGNVDKIFCNGDYFGNDYSGVVNVEVNDSCRTLDTGGCDRKKSKNLKRRHDEFRCCDERVIDT
jgi:hypothetical protein